MKRPSYRTACQWIADNDETAERDPRNIESLISVVLVADLFDVAPEIVAKDVMKRREPT